MSRNHDWIHTIKADLVCETPIHIGGVGGNEDSDLELATNGQGEFYIPGSSLAGALRTESSTWGSQDEASAITVRSAVLKGVGKEIREGVRIDPATGTAAFGAKYNRAILPRGTTFTLNVKATGNESMASLDELVQKLQGGRLRLGARKTVGFGRVSLQKGLRTSTNVATKAGVLSVLSLTKEGTSQTSFQAKANSSALLELEWQAHGPVMVKAAADGFAVKAFPEASQIQPQKVALVIPGSSIKGAYRSMALYIARTIKGEEGEAIVEELFGPRAGSETKRLGSLIVEDCYSKSSFSVEEWCEIASATERESIKLIKNGAFLAADHVAIDRWTGGAAEGSLFSVLEPHTVEWRPIYIEILEERLGDKTLIAKGLLSATLREMQLRRLPLGHGINRGMGDVELLGLPEQILNDEVKEAWIEWCK